MLAKRLIVTIILLPIGMYLIHLGGWPFSAFVALILGLASWEYVGLLRAGGHQPAGALVVGGGLLIILGRVIDGFTSAPWILSLLLGASMAYHLLAYERGREHAGTDFATTLTGALYAGWLGAYLISLRQLPDGKWWLLVVLTAVWLADSGAFFMGSKFGHRKLSPRLSPKKTWEGYLSGVVAGALGGALFAALWRIGAGPESAITAWKGALLGFVLAVVTPLGDLGESMLKRQVGMKDSGTILPGHGGALDRIDSWLWAAPIGYYAILWFFL